MSISENILQVNPLNNKKVSSFLTRDSLYSKFSDFEMLEHYYDSYNTFTKRIADIDQYLGIGEFTFVVSFQLRTNKLEPSIYDSTKPLENMGYWNAEMLKIADKIWQKLYKNNDISPFTNLLKDDNHGWIYTCKYELCPYNYLVNDLIEWNDLSRNINYSPIFTLFEKLIKYTILDAVKLVLLEERTGLVESTNFSITNICQYMSSIENDLILSSQLTNDNLLIFLPEYDFNKLYNDPLSASSLTNMHKAVQSIPGAKEYIKTIDQIDSANFYIRQITNHPLVEENGHSGNSFCWSVWTLKHLYNSGWEQFVKVVLNKRGVKNY